MAAHNFAELSRMARAQVTRRMVDASQLNITVSGTTVHMTGVLRPLAGHRDVDLKEEMNTISTILRGKSGISDVIWDVAIRV